MHMSIRHKDLCGMARIDNLTNPERVTLGEVPHAPGKQVLSVVRMDVIVIALA